MTGPPGDGPPERRGTLAELRQAGQRLRRADEGLRHAWAGVRQAAVRISALFVGVPVGFALARSLEGGPTAFGLFLMGPIAAGLAASGVVRALEWNVRRVHAPDPDYVKILQRCGELERVPDEVRRPIERALAAYMSVRQLSSDPAWRSSGVSLRPYTGLATTRMVELLEWARQLTFIGSHLRNRADASETLPELRETEAHYAFQCSQLSAAADAFIAAEAKLTLVYAANSGQQANQSRATDQLREISSTFDAMAEILAGAHRSDTDEALPARAPALEQQIRLGPRGDAAE